MYVLYSKYNLLNEKQFGFRTDNFAHMADKIASAVERNEPTVGMFLDMSKAFDTINHDRHILLYKLGYYSFRACAWFSLKTYLVTEKLFLSNA